MVKKSGVNPIGLPHIDGISVVEQNVDAGLVLAFPDLLACETAATN